MFAIKKQEILRLKKKGDMIRLLFTRDVHFAARQRANKSDGSGHLLLVEGDFK